MRARPKLDLSRLRQIGWARWDPIGLNGADGRPDDEYDSYLLQAAGRLWNGATEEEVARYLVAVEVERMGLSSGAGIEERARETAGALADYVARIRG